MMMMMMMMMVVVSMMNISDKTELAMIGDNCGVDLSAFHRQTTIASKAVRDFLATSDLNRLFLHFSMLS